MFQWKFLAKVVFKNKIKIQVLIHFKTFIYEFSYLFLFFKLTIVHWYALIPLPWNKKSCFPPSLWWKKKFCLTSENECGGGMSPCLCQTLSLASFVCCSRDFPGPPVSLSVYNTQKYLYTAWSVKDETWWLHLIDFLSYFFPFSLLVSVELYRTLLSIILYFAKKKCLFIVHLIFWHLKLK